jgi:hypothetical protein
VTRGNSIHGHEADVVTMARIGAARVAEADQQLHVMVVRK